MQQNRRTRREFIKTILKVFAVTIGILTLGKNKKKLMAKNKNISSPTRTIKSNKKILVAYESQFGSTAEVAEFIANRLIANKQVIEIKKICEVDDLASYSHVIIGSAIQYDNWMPEAREFIIENENELATKSVSFFLVCLVLSKNTKEAIEKADGYAIKTMKLVPKIKVNSFGKFAGVLNYSKMSFGQKILAKIIFAIIGVKEGEYRDWDAIKDWVKKLNF